MQPQPSFRAYLASALFLIVIGWGGLAALVIYTIPTVWPRWGFFLLWVMALTGLALPVSYFLHWRFPSDPPAEPNVIVRQALWVGVFGATIAWLQLGRLVTLWVVFGLAGGLVAIEYFLRMRERARWNPPMDPDEPTD